VTQQSLDDGSTEKEATFARIERQGSIEGDEEDLQHTQTRLSKTTIRSRWMEWFLTGGQCGDMVGKWVHRR